MAETIRRKKEKTESQLRTESIERTFSDKTDRQLLEEQLYLFRENHRNIITIKNIAQFFFWVTVLGMVLWVIAYYVILPLD